MDRRTFSKQLLTAVSGYALLQTAFTRQAFGKAVEPLTDHWALRLHEYCSDLKKSAISPIEWQTHVQALYSEIELEDLIKFIDFGKLQDRFDFPDLGVNTRPVRFPALTGLPEKTVFVKKIFGMKKDRAIIPQGHSNMASAHFILKGQLHLRHYEKLAAHDQRMLIRPTIDKTIRAGECSSISDEADNIHWFIAESESAFTFDVILLDLNGEDYDIHNLDMEAAEVLGDDVLTVPILDVETALKKYGKVSHH